MVAEISHLTTVKMVAGENFGTTHNDNLMVFITVQNLVAIALVF